VAFLLDGKTIVSSGNDRAVRVWDAETGRQLRHFDMGNEYLENFAVSATGDLVAAARNQKVVQLLELSSGQAQHELKDHTGRVQSLTFSPDGQTLACGDIGNIRLWQTKTGKPIRQFAAGAQNTNVMAFSPNGTRLAAGGDDGHIRLWDATTGKTLSDVQAHKDGVTTLTFTPDGKGLVSGGNDHAVRVWDLPALKEQRHLAHPSSILVVAMSRDGQTLFAAIGHAVRAWNLATGELLTPDHGPEEDVYSLAFTPDGKSLVAGSCDSVVGVWDLATTTARLRLDGHESYSFSVAVAPDGKAFASAGGKPFVRVRDLPAGKERGPVKGVLSYTFCVAYSPDGKWLAAGEREKLIHILDAANGNEVFKLRGTEGEVYALAFSPDGRWLATGGDAKMVHLWDLVARGDPLRLPMQQDAIHGLAFSPDGRTLAATGDNNTVVLWDLAAGQPRITLSGHTQRVNRLAFAPDGRTLASASNDDTVRLWDVAAGQERRRLAGHGGAVYGVAFAPDGKTLATCSADTTVLVWDTSGPASGTSSTRQLSSEDRERLWADLARGDAAKAYQAVLTLAADADGTAAFLRDRLKPAPRLDMARLDALVKDLADAKFVVREKASQELAAMDDAARPPLQKHLEACTSAEARRRLERLISNMGKLPPPETLRVLRAIEVLESIGTPAAREALEALAGGEPNARITQDAKQTLQRLEQKASKK
jgi:WD40 repeat protein